MDSVALMEHVDLRREDVMDPHWRGRSELLAMMVRRVWTITNDEFMGFMERPAKFGTFAMMCECIIGEPSLEAAFAKGIHFYNLFTDDISMRLDLGEENVVFHVVFRRPELDGEHYFLEFWFSIWYRLIGWLGGITAPLLLVTFPYPRPDEYAEEFKYMFPCEHKFNASRATMVFDRRHLGSPIVRAKEELALFLSVAPLGFMSTPRDVINYTRKVRSYLLRDRAFSLQFPELDKVARHFNMGAQTLRRKLKFESTSYRAIIENIRRDIAIEKLLNGSTSVSSISDLLGYSETRAFTRAFREWTKMSPLEYRRHFQGQSGGIALVSAVKSPGPSQNNTCPGGNDENEERARARIQARGRKADDPT
ncbi:MAG: helix-turn-helix transcriptional regulator [Burkholderiaceae bacterium]|nr:helix-turn-helix transcriptional regulator [Burkholderiaceae bacterium]